jgi:hypothetical protein
MQLKFLTAFPQVASAVIYYNYQREEGSKNVPIQIILKIIKLWSQQEPETSYG